MILEALKQVQNFNVGIASSDNCRGQLTINFNPPCYSVIFELLESLREEKAGLSGVCVCMCVCACEFVRLKDRVCVYTFLHITHYNLTHFGGKQHKNRLNTKISTSKP